MWCVVVCDREASILGRPWPTGGLMRHGGGGIVFYQPVTGGVGHIGFELLQYRGHEL